MAQNSITCGSLVLEMGWQLYHMNIGPKFSDEFLQILHHVHQHSYMELKLKLDFIGQHKHGGSHQSIRPWFLVVNIRQRDPILWLYNFSQSVEGNAFLRELECYYPPQEVMGGSKDPLEKKWRPFNVKWTRSTILLLLNKVN